MKSDKLATAIRAAAVQAGEAAVCGHLATLGLVMPAPPVRGRRSRDYRRLA